MKLVEKYLEKLQDNATGFAIDSFPEKKSVMRVVYPEQYVPNLDNRHNRIMIDFDGVINPYTKGWNNGQITDEPIPGVKEAIDELKQQGFEIIIFTTRASTLQNVSPTSEQLIKDLRSWLDEHEIYYDAITAEKVSALAYIDDKAIRFTNWSDVLKQVNEIMENEEK
jgi:ribonucleotide monophosphatase NagD (HAD superfamily)